MSESQLGWFFIPEWKVIIHSCSSHHQSVFSRHFLMGTPRFLGMMTPTRKKIILAIGPWNHSGWAVDCSHAVVEQTEGIDLRWNTGLRQKRSWDQQDGDNMGKPVMWMLVYKPHELYVVTSCYIYHKPLSSFSHVNSFIRRFWMLATTLGTTGAPSWNPGIFMGPTWPKLWLLGKKPGRMKLLGIPFFPNENQRKKTRAKTLKLEWNQLEWNVETFGNPGKFWGPNENQRKKNRKFWGPTYVFVWKSKVEDWNFGRITPFL